MRLSKCFRENWEGKKHAKIAVLATTKLNSIKIILKPLVDSDISHVEFMLVSNKKQNYLSHTQLADIEKEKLAEHRKRIRIDEILEQYERRNLRIKTRLTVFRNYETMLSYFLKFKKNTESKNPRISNTITEKNMLL